MVLITPNLGSIQIQSSFNYGAPQVTFTKPTTNSDGEITISSSNTNVATVAYDNINTMTLTIVGGGKSTITVTVPATSIYAEKSVTTSITVNRIYPIITPYDIPNFYVDSPAYRIQDPISTNPGPFRYTVDKPEVLSLFKNDDDSYSISPLTQGRVALTAFQDETNNFNSKFIRLSWVNVVGYTPISVFSNKTIEIGKTVLIDSLVSNSNGTVTYRSDDPSIATISGTNITAVSLGTVRIRVAIAQTLYYAEQYLNATFTVSKATPIFGPFVIIIPDGSKTYTITDPYSISPGNFTYTVDDIIPGTNIASVIENTLSIHNYGQALVTAYQAETEYYTSGTIQTIINVNKLTPTINDFYIPIQTFSLIPVKITPPNSTSSGSFIYTSSDELIATIVDDIYININGVGNCTITAIQEPTQNYTGGIITTELQVIKATPIFGPFIIESKPYGSVPFAIVDPISTSNGLISYTSSNREVAKIDNKTVTILSSGTSIITLIQAETNNYTSKTLSTILTIIKGTPLLGDITFESIIGNKLPYKPWPYSHKIINPSSPSDGSISYVSSDTSIASISGNNLNTNKIGNCRITATQRARNSYNEGTTFIDIEVIKETPLITGFSFPNISFKSVATQISNPNSTSDGTFSYETSNELIATITRQNNKYYITPKAVGSCELKLTQNETSTYYEGNAICIIIVDKAIPSIYAFSIDTVVYDSNTLLLNDPNLINKPLYTDSPGDISYTSDDPSIASITTQIIDNKTFYFLRTVSAGNCYITATISETDNYKSNSQKANLIVTRATPILTNFNIPTKTYGDAPFEITAPTSNSPGTFSYTSSNLSVATVSGNTITIVSVGTSIITANQAATINYTSGTITTTFVVTRVSPILTDFNIPTKIYGSPDFEIDSPQSNSQGTFSYTSSNLLVATIFGNVIKIIGGGTTMITAIQQPTQNYTIGTIDSIFVVTQATPTLTEFIIPVLTNGEFFTLMSPTSESLGDVVYTSNDLSIATINDKNILVIGVGSCIINACQLQTNNYISVQKETILTSIESTQETPTTISSGDGLQYFFSTVSVYANITETISITELLISTSMKILTSDNIDAKLIYEFNVAL